MRKSVLFVFTVVYLFTACNQNKETEDFFKTAKKIDGELVSAECLIGRPAAIMYAKPQKIILYDPYEGQLMSLTDLVNNRCVRFFQVGNGPDDIMPGFRAFTMPMSQTLGIYQHSVGRLNLYDLDDITIEGIEALHAQAKIQIEEMPTAANIISVGKYFVGNGMFEKGRVHLYDRQGKYVASGGKYPFNGEAMDPMSRFFPYQSYMASNGESKFAVAGAYGDNLEFYEIDGDSITLKKKYGTHDVLFTMENMMIKLHDDCMLGYKAAWGDEKYCYLLFSGKSYAENNRRTIGGRYLFVFTWDGRFVKSYETDSDILAFCADEKNKIIYAIGQYESENAVLRFAL